MSRGARWIAATPAVAAVVTLATVSAMLDVTPAVIAALAAWTALATMVLHVAAREGARRAPHALPHWTVGAMFALSAVTLAAGFALRVPGVAPSVPPVLGTVLASMGCLAGLILYPLARWSARDDVDTADAPATEWIDRLAVRGAFAVAVPIGASALLATLVVSTHLHTVQRDLARRDADLFNLTLSGDPTVSARELRSAAEVLHAGGLTVRQSPSGPRVEPADEGLPSPAWAVAVALAVAAVGAVLGARTGSIAARELHAARLRMEAVGTGRASLEPASHTTSSAEGVPEVREMADALDAVTATLRAMADDQRRALTTRLEAGRLRAFVLAGASHDLRGPLNAVLGFAGLLLSGVDGDVTEGQKESLEALSRGGRDMLRLVDELLDAARLDAGRMTLRREAMTVSTLLARARRAALERTGLAPGDDIVVPAEGALDAEVWVDPDRASQAVAALLAYAWVRPGAASPRTPTGAAGVSVRQEGATVTLRILGHGATPAQSTLDLLFDPLDVPPPGARAPGGLGLALSVARRLLELHGGSVQAEVAPEGGLALRLTLTGRP